MRGTLLMKIKIRAHLTLKKSKGTEAVGRTKAFF